MTVAQKQQELYCSKTSNTSLLRESLTSRSIPVKRLNQKSIHRIQMSLITKTISELNHLKLLNNLNELEPRESNFLPFKNTKIKHLTWSSDDKHATTILSNDSKSACLHSNCSGCFETHALRTSQPLSKTNAFTYWQVNFKEHSVCGTSVQVGIGIGGKAAMHSNGYLDLLGIDKSSWALSNKGLIWHDNKSIKYCEPFDSDKDVSIGCLYDSHNGRLGFVKNQLFLGWAFNNIQSLSHELLYPMVSTTASKCIVRINQAYESFPTLKDLCKRQLSL